MQLNICWLHSLINFFFWGIHSLINCCFLLKWHVLSFVFKIDQNMIFSIFSIHGSCGCNLFPSLTITISHSDTTYHFSSYIRKAYSLREQTLIQLLSSFNNKKTLELFLLPNSFDFEFLFSWIPSKEERSWEKNTMDVPWE